MTRTANEQQRRRDIADASSGLPGRIIVVLYTCIHDARDPEETLTTLRRHAEARDWVVHSALYDNADITSIRSDRKAWPKAETLLKQKEATGLVAPSEAEIALHPMSKNRLREWLHSLPAFASYACELAECEAEPRAPRGTGPRSES
ncbi:hypothetical protein [Streptomyces sp. NPDC002537]